MTGVQTCALPIFELLCAACVYDDGEVSLEPTNKTTSFKFRYGSFQGDMVPFTNLSQLIPFHDRAQMIKNGYGAPEAVLEIRNIRELIRQEHRDFRMT